LAKPDERDGREEQKRRSSSFSLSLALSSSERERERDGRGDGGTHKKKVKRQQNHKKEKFLKSIRKHGVKRMHLEVRLLDHKKFRV